MCYGNYIPRSVVAQTVPANAQSVHERCRVVLVAKTLQCHVGVRKMYRGERREKKIPLRPSVEKKS